MCTRSRLPIPARTPKRAPAVTVSLVSLEAGPGRLGSELDEADRVSEAIHELQMKKGHSRPLPRKSQGGQNGVIALATDARNPALPLPPLFPSLNSFQVPSCIKMDFGSS